MSRTSKIKHSKPWNLEIYRNFDESFSEDHLLINYPIRRFLEDEEKLVLVGAKGLGKTLFLRYKSHLYHKQYGDKFRFNADNKELTENLNLNPDTFSKEELLGFRDEGIWRLIWQLSFWVIIFRLNNLEINKRLEQIIGHSRELSAVITRLLNNRNIVDQYREFLVEFQEQSYLIENDVALFVDDVDQALSDVLNKPHNSDVFFDGQQSPSVDVWVNAQIALVGAIYLLKRKNTRIKIYATIRREAFEAFQGEMKINYQHHISGLNYSKDEIKEIFLKNIELMKPDILINPEAPIPIRRFLGFDQTQHPFATDPQGNKRKEDAFNFIYRHTFGRPREIVLMGEKIEELVVTKSYREASDPDRYDKLREVVNNVSNYLLGQYREEIVPYLDEVKLEEFIKNARSNVIKKEDFRLFDQDILRKYYNIGLLGVVRQRDASNLLVQSFNPAAHYNYRYFKAIPNTDFLLIHSTMDALLLDEHHYGNFYNRYNIISDGYEFYPKVDNPIYSPEHYFPRDIVGDRFNAPREASGHSFPLNEIYRHFFNFDGALARYDRFQMDWRTAERVLGLLGRICFCHRLEKQFKLNYYRQKKEESIADLARYHYRRQYNAEIKDATSDTSHERFMDKLMGRYIVLVSYLILDLRLEWIHSLLLNGHFEFKKNTDKKDTAFSYIQKSFFIRELKKSEPRYPNDHQHKLIKQRIFNHLSAFEQSCILEFVRNASDEVNYLEWITDTEHKTWLKKNVLDVIWTPEALKP